MKSLLFLMFLYAGSSNGQLLVADSAINKRSLIETLGFLSHDTLGGRLTGSNGANIAAAFIAEKFHSIGLHPIAGNQGYFDYFDAHHILAKNVVGIIPGKGTNDTMVIFSAHYDHVGVKGDMPYYGAPQVYDVPTDDIFNGANDNATGVAALIELSKYYKMQNNNRYVLVFVAFAGEEEGLLGSKYMMKKTNPKAVIAVINLEMLGRPIKDNLYIISHKRNITITLNDYLKRYESTVEKSFFKNDPYPDKQLYYRADHYPFSRKVKNAFTIMSSSPDDKYYHSVGDEYGTIDLDFLLKATKNIAMACEVFIK